MKKLIATLGVAALALPALAAQPTAGDAKQTRTPPKAQPAARGPHTIKGQLTLFENGNYTGGRWVIDAQSRRVKTDWNIRSISVHPGDKWQICARTSFRDPCIVLDRSVPDAKVIGIEGQIGSARPAPEGAGG